MKKYRISQYKEDEYKPWMIEERVFLFFHKPLRVDRIFSFSGSSKILFKRNVILTFNRVYDATAELEFLLDGGKPLKVICEKNGEINFVTRKLSFELVVTLISGSYKQVIKKGTV